MKYYATATVTHTLLFSYLSFFFRFRRLNRPQVLFVGSAYYLAFGLINNILYKTIIDRPIINEVRKMGQE